jgi:hypothetical protein
VPTLTPPSIETDVGAVAKLNIAVELGPGIPDCQLAELFQSAVAAPVHMVFWAEANPGKPHRMITGPAIRAAIRDVRRKQTPKEENTQRPRRLAQGQVWRSVSRSALLLGGTFGNAIRRPCSTRIEGREISRRVRGDGSTLRLHRSSFDGITLSATKGHTLFLKAPWQITIVRRRASEATVLLSKYLTRVGNPKVASPKMRRVDELRSQSVCQTENRHGRRSRSSTPRG